MAKLDLDNIYTYHEPHGDQMLRYARIRSKCKELAKLLEECCPDSRERSVALSKVQETCMWGNAAIAINEKG